MGAWWVRERWVVVSSFRRGCTATNSNCRPSLSLSLSTFSLLLSQLMHHWLLHNISLSLFQSFSLSSTACTPSDCWRPKGNAKKKSMIIINFFFWVWILLMVGCCDDWFKCWVFASGLVWFCFSFGVQWWVLVFSGHRTVENLRFKILGSFPLFFIFCSALSSNQTKLEAHLYLLCFHFFIFPWNLGKICLIYSSWLAVFFFFLFVVNKFW